MAKLKHLWNALDFNLSDIWRVDLLVGIAGGVSAGILGGRVPQQVIDTGPWAAAVVGAIIGAVVTGLSVQVAFLDQPFLRKLRAIGSDPVRFLAPFMFTAVLGVVSLLPIVILSNLDANAPVGVVCTIAAIAGLASFWTVASVLPDLDTLIQFVRLKVDALDVPDDVGKESTRFKDGRGGSTSASGSGV